MKLTAENTSVRYSLVAMTLHWLIALAILANVAIAFYFNDLLSHRDAARGGLVSFHESIGLTVLVLSAARLIWRWINPPPPLPDSLSPASKRVSHITHYSLYGLMIFVPLLGWGLASASRKGLPVNYFHLLAWPNIAFISGLSPLDKHFYGELIGTAHEWLGYAFFFLALGHIGAALYHRFVLRDAILSRMLPA